MMRRAGRVHSLRAIAFGVVILALAAAGVKVWQRSGEAEAARISAAKAWVQQLLQTDTVKLPGILQSSERQRPWTDPLLRQLLNDPLAPPKTKLHAGVALVADDASQAIYLEERLLDPDPGQLVVLRGALLRFAGRLAPDCGP